MHRQVDLLSILFAGAIVSSILCFLSMGISSDDANYILEKISSADKIGNIGEYEYVAEGTQPSLITYGKVVAQIFFVMIIPVSMMIVNFILQLFIKLIGFGKSRVWKERFSSFISYCLISVQSFLCALLLFNTLTDLTVNKLLQLIALFINIFILLILIGDIIDRKKMYRINSYNK